MQFLWTKKTKPWHLYKMFASVVARFRGTLDWFNTDHKVKNIILIQNDSSDKHHFLRTLIVPCLTARTKKYHIKTAIHVEKAELFVLNDWIFYSSKFCPCLPIFLDGKWNRSVQSYEDGNFWKVSFCEKLSNCLIEIWPVATLSGIFQNVEVKLIFWKCIFTLRLSI